jgi:Acid sphingomyelin phosphodiesterase C-terminal region
VIKFGLFGHDHKESIQVVTSPKNPKQRIGLNLLGGSATSFWKLNPSFNVINIDDQLMIPLTIQTHFFNISQGSLSPGKAKWDLLYNFT